MATLQITEFSDLARDARNQIIQSGDLDKVVTSQTVDYTASTQSSALDKRTRFVRLIADADCHVAVGANPTATATSTRLEANVAEYFAVQPGDQPDAVSGSKIAAYDGSS